MRVVGYVCDGDIACPDCADEHDLNTEGAVYASEELDCPQGCGTCGRVLACTLTAEGHAYVRQTLRESFRRGYRRNEALRPNGPRYFYGTAGGSVAIEWVHVYRTQLTAREHRAMRTMLARHVGGERVRW